MPKATYTCVTCLKQIGLAKVVQRQHHHPCGANEGAVGISITLTSLPKNDKSWLHGMLFLMQHKHAI